MKKTMLLLLADLQSATRPRGKRFAGTIALCCCLLFAFATPARPQGGANEWIWMGGNSTMGFIEEYGGYGDPGVYGTLGTPAAGNIPGSRTYAASWTGTGGNLWLFGGEGYDANGNLDWLNDLWEFNPSTSEWAWMAGSSKAYQVGVYGTLGTPAAGNTPGARQSANGWTDSSGHLWLFGGYGSDANGNCCVLNDLWEFDPSTNEWAWMGGSSTVPGYDDGQPGVYGTLGTPAAGNIPGGRMSAASWTDGSGQLWLFGGFGYDGEGNSDVLNDLWEYNPSTNEWTWRGGSSTVPCNDCSQPGAYGALGMAAAGNTPGGRQYTAGWTDNNGQLWLFGGYGFDANGNAGDLNDLWAFNLSTSQWTWMGGSSTVGSHYGQPGVYGILGTPAGGNTPGSRDSATSWTDSSGNLWLFGGYGYDASGLRSYLNDIWEFNPSTDQWTWMGGSSTAGSDFGQPGEYGTLGTPAAGNTPGGRDSATSWTDSSGQLWLFGGLGYYSFGPLSYSVRFNDLWKYQSVPPLILAATVTTLTSSQNPSFYGQAVTLAANVTSSTGAPPNGETVTFMSATTTLGTGTLSGGTASFTTSALPVGAYSVTAVYGGDANFAGSTSTAVSQTVGQANSATMLTSSPNPSTFATLVTFTATVSGQFSGTATGTVTFRNGSATLGTAALSGGSAVFTFTALPQGTDSITAAYSGDSSFTGSTSNSESQVVTAEVAAVNEWTWMGGSSTGQQPGVYGALGTPAVGNSPGSRYDASSWTDSSGNLWLFGGYGYDAIGSIGFLNDLWEFTPSTNQWAWMGGSSTVPNDSGYSAQSGVYGALGTPAAGNIPGGRSGASSWTDSSGNLWLFGGGYFNDLWEFNPSTNQWAWMGGSGTPYQPGIYGTLGTPAAGNNPGGRLYASSWTDSSGNLWLFGGEGYDVNGNGGYLNDLWEFNPPTNQWAWMGGSGAVPANIIVGPGGQPGVYGTLGMPAAGNTPGGRINATSWADARSNLWLFGGAGYDANGNSGYLNDLWEFNPSTNQWTWMGGSSLLGCNRCGPPGVFGKLGKPAAADIPGGRYGAASWTDSSGDFWLFGGGADSGYINDLWEFSPFTNEWAWMGGGNTANLSGVYGVLGTAAAGNIPGIRGFASSWTGSDGNFWLFGGFGFDANGNWSWLNDIWRYQPVPPPPAAAAPTFSPPGGSYTAPLTMALSTTTSGASIRYTTDGSRPSDTAGTPYTGPITVSSTTTIKAIAYVSGLANSTLSRARYLIRAVAPTFSPDGGTYTAPQTVALSTTTRGAAIYYTTNGSKPSDTAGTLYTGPVAVSVNMTIKAVAYASGLTESTVNTATYKIRATAPTFSPAGGTYTAAQTITLSTTTSGASINYTTDGSAPSDTAGTLYTGPIAVSVNTTIKAVAYASGLANSAVNTATYKIRATAPTFSPAGGTYTAAQTITLSTTTSGASINYTTDGTTPSDTGGTPYTGPITVGSTKTIKAIAYGSGLANSTVSTAKYKIGN